jgi:hypothetical protein
MLREAIGSELLLELGPSQLCFARALIVLVKLPLPQPLSWDKFW